MPVLARSSVERWECPDCGRVLLPGEQKPRRSYHHWKGERCDGEWQKIRYVPEAEIERLRKALHNIAWSGCDPVTLSDLRNIAHAALNAS